MKKGNPFALTWRTTKEIYYINRSKRIFFFREKVDDGNKAYWLIAIEFETEVDSQIPELGMLVYTYCLWRY